VGGQGVRLGPGTEAVEAQAAEQDRGPDRFRGSDQVAERLLKQLDGAVGGASSGGCLGRPGQQLDPVQPSGPLRIGDPLPQLQGALIVSVGFGEGASLLGRLACGDPGR
jgi:hypothetical protein